ncbi:transposase [Streptomyces sp. NPDC057686]|uniref:helix-turn-helix domain-containing protein n=1 Tax=Streptomyces sp. NPDC057686 TaxID=3346212 RepID=UPI00367ED0EC
MARTGRPKADLTLSDEERAALEGWVRRRSTPQAWVLRCRIILACAEGASNKDVAARLGSTSHAVGRWRARFEHRIAGLGDMPRSGGPRSVTDEQVAALVSVSDLAGVRLQPHRSETFKLSTDPYFYPLFL